MLNWIKSLLNIAVGDLDALWRKVLSVITTIWNNLWGYVQDLYRNVVQLADDIRRLSSSLSSWIARTYNGFVRWTENTFNSVIRWADNELSSIRHDLSSLISWAQKEFDYGLHYAEHLVDDARSWVINDVWNPLFHDISVALGWIGKEGAFMYALLTHPDKLADLLIGYGTRSWLTLFRKYGKTLIALGMSSWRSATPDIVSILEDIISSLL